MDIDRFSDVNFDIGSINDVKLIPEDFIVVKVELDIGSEKRLGPPHHSVFTPLGQVVPDLSIEASRYLRVARGPHAIHQGYSFEPGNTPGSGDDNGGDLQGSGDDDGVDPAAASTKDKFSSVLGREAADKLSSVHSFPAF